MAADPELLGLFSQGREAWAAASNHDHREPPDLAGADLRSFRLEMYHWRRCMTVVRVHRLPSATPRFSITVQDCTVPGLNRPGPQPSPPG